MAELHRRSQRVESPAPVTRGLSSASPGEGKQLQQSVVGMRACIALIGGFLPVTILNIVVPLIALYKGDIKLPYVLISDVMSAHPVYEAAYTWGFCITMLNVCFVLREASLRWRIQIPERKANVAIFLGIMYGIMAPSLFGLVAFQYKHDLAILTDGHNVSTLDTVLWLLHCGFTSSFFLSASYMAFIYGWRLNPTLLKGKFLHPADLFWRMGCVNGICLVIFVGIAVRYLHLFHSHEFWAIPLVLVEVALIQLMQGAVFLGFLRDMMSLDASDPIVTFFESCTGRSQ